METSTPTPVADQYTLSRLFRRAWTILFKEPRGKGRVSIGESILAGMLLSLVMGVVSVPLSWISLILPAIVSVVGLLWSLGYLMRRAHDIGKSNRYVVAPVIGIVLINILSIFGVASFSLFSFSLMSSVVGGILTVVFLIIAIWAFVVFLNLLFKKGTSGDNAYGTDPLLHQPKGNGLYRGARLILLIVIIVVSFFEKKPVTTDYAHLFGTPGSDEYEQMQQLNEQIKNLGDQAQVQAIIDQATAQQQEGGE